VIPLTFTLSSDKTTALKGESFILGESHFMYGFNTPITVAAWSEIRAIKHRGSGFKSGSRHGCLCVFNLFLLSCV
jgi:hypothetical protein